MKHLSQHILPVMKYFGEKHYFKKHWIILGLGEQNNAFKWRFFLSKLMHSLSQTWTLKNNIEGSIEGKEK